MSSHCETIDIHTDSVTVGIGGRVCDPGDLDGLDPDLIVTGGTIGGVDVAGLTVSDVITVRDAAAKYGDPYLAWAKHTGFFNPDTYLARYVGHWDSIGDFVYDHVIERGCPADIAEYVSPTPYVLDLERDGWLVVELRDGVHLFAP